MKLFFRLFLFSWLFLYSMTINSCIFLEKVLEKKSPSSEAVSKPALTPLDQMIQDGPSKNELSPAERELYDLIMQYRNSKGLPSIPLSKSLSYVAQLHVRDLSTHTFAAPANMHSWSSDGPWKAVNYTPDHAQAALMWSKPSELTSYKSEGFEIAYMNGSGATAVSSLSGWKSSSAHNSVIINAGAWATMPWKAIGIGIYRNYAVVWFGTTIDPQK